jgi:hypothetical protein
MFALMKVMEMPIRIFDLFTRIIDDAPAGAVLKELELECEMLERDHWRQQKPLTQENFSILRFGRFVHAAKAGREICFVEALPPGHLTFYKHTVLRLIRANELPLSAADQFDHTFSIAA